jgi:hypothetical protein
MRDADDCSIAGERRKGIRERDSERHWVKNSDRRERGTSLDGHLET